MRPLLLIIIALTLVVACKKEGKMCCLPPRFIEGVWIEKSQRLDTLDFESGAQFNTDNKQTVQLKARPYMDVTVSTVYPSIYSTFYSYYFEQGTIRMRNFVSSSTAYVKFDFAYKPDFKSFTIQKFYGRPTLPDTLEFEKLK